MRELQNKIEQESKEKRLITDEDDSYEHTASSLIITQPVIKRVVPIVDNPYSSISKTKDNKQSQSSLITSKETPKLENRYTPSQQ